MCVCVRARACVCVCGVCVERWLADGEVTSSMPMHAAAAVVSLSKELYSYCSIPPSCINGDLTIAGEAIAKVCN